MMTVPAPRAIRALRNDGVLEVTWSGQPPARLSFHDVRCFCPCAGCIDEISGVRTLNPASVPHDVTPTRLEFVGNYALKVEWSDGHSTGLYTWTLLDQLTRECSKSN